MKSAGLKSSLHLAKDNVSLDKGRDTKRVSRSRLINHLNRINFRDGAITLHFKHTKYNHAITLLAKPQICNDSFLRCLWSEYADAEQKLKYFSFVDFTFTDGLVQIQVPARLIELTENGVYLELPEACFEKKTREIKRHKCKDVSAQISQDGKIINGHLTSFSAQSLGISFRKNSSYSNQTLDRETPVSVILENEYGYIYSGNCDIIRQTRSSNRNYLVLKPVKDNIQLFRPKEIRSERLTLNPLPNIILNHPLIRKKINLSLIDISGTGFAIGEDEDSALLMPGMILPELEVEFLHGFSITCKAQVVYRITVDDSIKCGVAILDMDIQDHLKLSSFLHQAKNRHSYISTTNVDLDALWDFFFETGFVYPEKYAHIIDQKERFHSLYRKLYNESPEISRHVIYQDRGKIYGHVSMIRYYQNTWLMHHHAAVKSSKHKAGLVVMEHILQYINECHTLASARMKYIACYFQPKNRFANRVFGGAARALEDMQKCSLDDFAYFHIETDPEINKISSQWTMVIAEPEDLLILSQWYRERSGGLLLEGLDLVPDAHRIDMETSREYRRAGFERLRKIFSLKKDGELQAVLVVNRSDLGLNMSDLTNCIQVFVLEESRFQETQLRSALAELAGYYKEKEISVLLYPDSYAKNHSIPFDKIYELTVLDLDYLSPYLLFMQSLTTQRNKKVRNL
jgi:hypothetical protein